MTNRMRREGWYVLPGMAVAVFYVLYVWFGDHLIYFEDTCSIFRRATEISLDGKWPLVGNPFFMNFYLGPFADYLTALPYALTGQLRSSYYFVWLLYLFSVPLFYIAIRRRVASPIGACWATVWFAWFPMLGELMVTPWNTSYLPIFLALFMLLLLSKPKGAKILLLYTVVGLSVQLHFTCVLLLVAAYLMLLQDKPTSTGSVLWHFGGIIIAIGLNGSAIWYHLHTGAGAALETAEQAVALGQSFGWSILFFALTLLPAICMLPLLLLTALARRNKLGRLLGSDALALRLHLAIPVMIAAIALVQAWSHNLQGRYYIAVIPLICLLIGLAAHHYYDRADSRRQRMATILLTITTMAFASIPVFSNAQRPYQRLTVGENTAEKLHQWLTDNDLVGATRFHQQWYARYHETIYQKESNAACLETLLRVRHPHEYPKPDAGVPFNVYSIYDANVKPVVYKTKINPDELAPLTACPAMLRVDGMEHYLCPRRDDRPFP